VTARQAAQRVEKLRLQLAATILRSLKAGGARLASEAKRLMPKKSKKIDPYTRLPVDPPNPPPGPLAQRTGALAKSISAEPKMKGPGRYVLELKATAAYAAIHEYGGTTGPHEIVPRNAKWLCFNWPKNPFGLEDPPIYFLQKVNHPGSKIPARPYLRPAMEKVAPALRAQLEAQIQAFAQAAMRLR
jgi:phage gpG-like protein